jgi:hypothetical protein
MQSLFEFLSHQPYWIFNDDQLILRSGEHKLVSVKLGKKGKSAKFKIEKKDYTIGRDGYWLRQMHISEGNEELLTARHFSWKPVMKIKFTDGNRYELGIKQSDGLTLQFREPDKRLLFNIRLEENGSKPAVILKVHYHHIPKAEMLFLFILGAFVTQNLIQEEAVKKLVKDS